MIIRDQSSVASLWRFSKRRSSMPVVVVILLCVLSMRLSSSCIVAHSYNINFPTALAFAATVRPFSSTSTTTKIGHTQRQLQSEIQRRRRQLLLFSSPDSSAGITSNGDDEVSLPTSFSLQNTATSTTATVTKNMINGATSDQVTFDENKVSSFSMSSALDRVRKISNFASFLCVLDCTLLPIITVALPLLGVLNLGSSQLQAIDQLGHSLALFFVLPVGGLTTTINYISHRKKWISSLAIIGLTMVGLANSHIHIHHWPTLFGGTISLNWIGSVLHAIQGCGTSPWHRIVNVSGCAFLLGSNYLSQQQDGCAHGDHDGDCGHNHDHNHDHSEGNCDH